MLQQQINGFEWLQEMRNAEVKVEAGCLKVFAGERSIEKIRRRLVDEIEESPYWAAAIYSWEEQERLFPQPRQVVGKAAHLQPVHLSYSGKKLIDAKCAIPMRAVWLMQNQDCQQQILDLIESGAETGCIQSERDCYRWKFTAQIVRKGSIVEVFVFDAERWQGWYWKDNSYLRKMLIAA